MVSLSIGIRLCAPYVKRAAFSEQATQFFDRLTTQPSDDDKARYAALIDNLVAAQIFERGDLLHIYAAPSTNAARTNLLRDTTIALSVNSPTFTAYRGYQGNGSSSYIRTQFNLASDSLVYAQNAASVGIWSLTNRAANSKAAYGASDGATKNTHAYLLYPTSDIYARLNGPEGAGIVNTSGRSDGFFLSNRSGSTERQLYRNGVSMGAYPASASAALLSQGMYVSANNINGTASGHSSDEIAAFWLGTSLDATEQADLYAILSGYLTSAGAIT